MNDDRDRLIAEIDARTDDFNKRQAEFEEERKRYTEESQKRLKSASQTFVSTLVSQLDTREREMAGTGSNWAVFGGGVLLFGTIGLGVISWHSFNGVTNGMDWPLLMFFALKGSILAGALFVLSRYAFLQSGNYMSEALRTVDRIHTIKFGQFFVETYGGAASWEQVKDAFSNWHGGEKTTWLREANKSDSEAIPNALLDKLTDVIKPGDK